MTTGTAPQKEKVKAIFIDAFEKTVTEIEMVPELSEYYSRLKCDCITIGYSFPNSDILFVDDNGLLTNPKHFFRIHGIDYDYAGNGIIIGTDPTSEDECDVKIKADYLGVIFQELVPAPAGNG